MFNITDPRPLLERRCNLQGHVLTVGWIERLPYVYTSNDYNNGGISGINYDIASSLALQCNFSLELQEFNTYGVLQDDGRWTGLVEKLRTKKLDLEIASMIITKERAEVIDFSIGLQNFEFTLFMGRSNEEVQWKTFVNAFSNQFWVCLIFSIIVLTMYLCTIKKFSLGKKIDIHLNLDLRDP